MGISSGVVLLKDEAFEYFSYMLLCLYLNSALCPSFGLIVTLLTFKNVQ